MKGVNDEVCIKDKSLWWLELPKREEHLFMMADPLPVHGALPCHPRGPG